MIKWFVCVDGSQIEIDKCLASGGCPFKERCAARPVLKKIAIQREWKGIPSTTQLLKGTRQAYLEIVHDYAVTPDDRIFMLLGTTIHNDLEKLGDEISLAELDLSDEEGSIRPDLLEYENGKYIMVDYKVCGSYVLEKALGLYKIDVPDLDPETGEQLLYKSGDKKGKPKTHKEVRQDDSKIDLGDWPLQLNNYRIGLEKKLGIKISALKVQAIVRDGGTAIAVGRGIKTRSKYIDIPMLDDKKVLAYFDSKKNALLAALKKKIEPVKCTDEERWYDPETKQDRKCIDYCPVNKFCSYWKEKYQQNITIEERFED